jgi:predicted nucleic acid-binding protein
MISVYEQTHLDPRDSLHLATIKQAGLSTIISEDNDFNNIKTVKRINAQQFIDTQLHH